MWHATNQVAKLSALALMSCGCGTRKPTPKPEPDVAPTELPDPFASFTEPGDKGNEMEEDPFAPTYGDVTEAIALYTMPP
jgi:hypothetical protein